MAEGKSKRNLQGIISLVVIGLLVLFYLILGKNKDNTSSIDRREVAFRHNPVKLTSHARCRMDCRKIDEKEIKDILETGKINYRKSDLKDQPCASYAVEGITSGGQKIRVVVGNCNKEAVIITVIDLENDPVCDCN